MKKKNDKFRGLLTDKINDANIILTGIPYDKGCSCGSGASAAPKMIRELSSYLPPLTIDGEDISRVKLYDNGDIKVNGKDTYKNIEIEAEKLIETKKFLFFIGGDHSTSIPIERAFLKKCSIDKIPAIIHIDAHPDICDIYNESNISHACTNRRAIDNGLSTKNLVMIGIRGYEKQEVEYLKLHPEIKVYRASLISNEGYYHMVDEICERFDERYEIYLSYDIDANDPSYAPGTGTPEAFGLNSIVLKDIIIELVKRLNVRIMDIMEVSPKLDSNNITSWLALKTMYEIFNVIDKKK